MKIKSSPLPLAEQTADALVVMVRDSGILLPPGNTVLKKLTAELMKGSAFKGEAGQVALFPTFGKLPAKQIIIAGLGAQKDFHNGLLEQAAAAAVRSGQAAGLSAFAVASTLRLKDMPAAEYQLLTGRGACWGTYVFSTFRKSDSSKKAASLVFAGPVEDRTALKTAELQGATLLDTADLANLPGNEATPAKIVTWARAMARRNGLSCQVLGKAELARKGCGGILAVGQGSAREPRLIILKYSGTDKKARPVALIGKTVTFDSGGISLKPGKNMGWMRYDKCGGMAVLAAMQMAARMKVKTPVIGILGVVENMPGPNATRPGDIIRARNGKTIEVLNTDAEGRLVLADALGLAADLKPAAMVDLATLTGAVIGALGYCAAAVLGNDDRLIQTLIKAGANSGERLWPLPLWKEYSDEMKSDFADLSNLCKSGSAGTSTAAAFLKEFVPEDIAWAHIDIAGTAWLESGKPHQAPGATLFGARLLMHWISRL